MPKARLVNAFSAPFDNAVATARTCYSPRIIKPEDVSKDERARSQRDAIAASTYAAGHHTTLQHATFQFTLENISRQLIWSFLHAHPHYNSEQVSQRYVAVRADKALIPRLPDRADQLYRDTLAEQMACYRDLCELLQPNVSRHYFSIFPSRRKHQERYAGEIRKKAQEVARYVLPVATFAHLYHTVSGLTLHRYHRLCRSLDVPTETRWVVEGMVRQVDAADASFFSRIEDPLPLEETQEYALFEQTAGQRDPRRFCREFDAELENRASKLVSFTADPAEQLARAARAVLGLCKDQLSENEALELLLSPAKNPYSRETLNLSSLSKLGRTLDHVHFTFMKRLSHTADSQDQRHRTVPGSRPVLWAQYAGGEPDVVVPELLRRQEQALERFMETMQHTWNAIDALLDQGVNAELASYLLPNAFPIRFVESGSLSGLQHKWSTRLCFNAQEEIWRASVDEVEQLRQVSPEIGVFQLPPCGRRHLAHQRPYCPEGPRFCGVRAWGMDPLEYERVL